MTNEEAIEFLKNNGCDERTSECLTPDTCTIDRCELKCAVEKAVDADKRFRVAINIAVECMDKEVVSWTNNNERNDPNEN